jgi:hypothetical protein
MGMKVRSKLPRAMGLLALGSVGVGFLAASGLPLAGATSPSATPAASSAQPTSALPTISGADVPEAPSSPPTAAEWKNARAVRPNRGDAGPCQLVLVREWLEVRCKDIAGGGLVAGDPKDVTVRTTGSPFGEVDPERQLATRITLPLRRGEAKIFSFMRVVFEYSGSGPGESGTLSIVWRAGRADPTLVMNGIATSIEP